jgi:hypothetical protein
MTKSSRKQKAVKLTIVGDSAHNSGIQMAIGGLMIGWSNNESVFMAMLQCLIGGGTHSASIVWHSIRTTQARLDLIYKLSREQIKDQSLLDEMQVAIRNFKGLSGVRHFFAHATYGYSDDLKLASASSVTLTADGYPHKSERKVFDLATINEINHATLELAKINQRLWDLVIRVQDALEVRRITLPQLPPSAPHP